jgi:hypothetical protein
LFEYVGKADITYYDKIVCIKEEGLNGIEPILFIEKTKQNVC